MMSHLHTMKFERELGDTTPLSAYEVGSFVGKVPPEAHIAPIMKEIGSQRDPVQVMLGLTARWQDANP